VKNVLNETANLNFVSSITALILPKRESSLQPQSCRRRSATPTLFPAIFLHATVISLIGKYELDKFGIQKRDVFSVNTFYLRSSGLRFKDFVTPCRWPAVIWMTWSESFCSSEAFLALSEPLNKTSGNADV